MFWNYNNAAAELPVLSHCIHFPLVSCWGCRASVEASVRKKQMYIASRDGVPWRAELWTCLQIACGSHTWWVNCPKQPYGICGSVSISGMLKETVHQKWKSCNYFLTLVSFQTWFTKRRKTVSVLLFCSPYNVKSVFWTPLTLNVWAKTLKTFF